MKLPFSKREWLGATLLLVGLVTLAMFLIKLWLIASWVRGEYTGPKEFGAFRAWVTDPANRRSLEPVASLAETVTALFVSIASFIFAGLRGKRASPAIAPALQSRVADWHIIRPLLIATVRGQNVTGYEESSIFEGVRIALGAAKAPEALDRYYHAERRTTGENLRLHKNGAAILKVFTESGGTLLIQGEPGSGKSYTLHQLAARLLAAADEKAEAPVPVVVPLASWAIKKLPLDQWLAGELSIHYRLSAKDTPLLLAEGGRLALLLDGLDEVTESARAGCLAAIQKFMGEFRAPISICCRVQEYRDLPERIAHGESIRLLPLTPEQVDGYLAEFDATALAPLRELLKTDAHWATLASTPLMLGIMARVYAAGGSVPGGDASQEEKRDALLDFYVREMFTRKARTADGKPVPEEACFTQAQAIHWLQQLAKKMGTAPTYYIERMQPEWVGSRWRSKGLVSLSGGLAGGFTHGLPGVISSGLAGVLLAALLLGDGPVKLVGDVRLRIRPRWLLVGIFVGLAYYLFLEPVVGVIAALIIGLFEYTAFHQPTRPNQGIVSSSRNSLLYAIILGSIGALFGAYMGHVGKGVAWGLGAGLLFSGGQAVIQHYAIRLALAWEGALPHPLSDRKLIAFLDAMRDRMLLRRPPGKGGWDFIHRELQEFLARCPYGKTPAEIEVALRSQV